MTNESTTRAAAIELLRSGLATLSEVAELAGESRQLVRYWAMQEGIEPLKIRRNWLTKAWKEATRGRK